MAKRDVVLYFLQVQNKYLEMLENVKDLEEALKTNHIEQSQFEDAQKEIETIKNNYERLAYVMLLLNKPNRKKKQLKEERENKYWYDYLQGSSKEAILDENKSALVDFKELVKRLKDGN